MRWRPLWTPSGTWPCGTSSTGRFGHSVTTTASSSCSHHYVGLPLGEIAEILDIPYGTVGSRLHHAIRSMRATIDAAERTAIQEGQPA